MSGMILNLRLLLNFPLFLGSLVLFFEDHALANLSAPTTKTDHFITDSLVKNLSCNKLSPYNVLTFVRQDAFSKDRHLPFINWWSTLQPGNCWGLSQAQRRLFYLIRFNERGASNNLNKTNYEQILNIAGPDFENIKINKMITTVHSTLNRMEWKNGVFQQGPSGLFLDFLRSATNATELFRQKVEAAQDILQVDIENINILFESRKHDHTMNHLTYQTIVSSLKLGRMPLLVIKFSLFDYHVVLVKSMTNNSMDIYDSNAPFLAKKMYYLNGEFYIPDINMGHTGKEPLSIFINGEDDMNRIQKINFEYYSGLCRSLEH
jgi:hypothetical protein